MTATPDYLLTQARDSVRREPMNHAAWNNLAMLLIDNGIYDEASLCLDNVRSLNAYDDPQYSIDSEVWMWLNFARLHEKLGLLDEAKADMDAVRELYKEKERTMADTSKDWHNLARNYRAIHDCDEEIRCLEKANVLDSGDPLRWRDLGALYRDKGDLEKAKICYETAIQVNWSGDKYHKEDFAAELYRSLADILDALGDAVGAEQYRQKESEMRAVFQKTLIDEQRVAEAEWESELAHSITLENQERVRDLVVALLDSGQCKSMKGVADILEPSGIDRIELQFFAQRKWQDFIVGHVHHELIERWSETGYGIR